MFLSMCVSAVEGRPDEAVARLRATIAAGAPPLWTNALRRQLGVLLGDEEGKQLITEADSFLRAGGVVDPGRFAATLYPGIEPR